MNYGERNLKKPGDEVSFRSVFTSHSVAPHEDATEVAGAPRMTRYFTNASPSVAEGPRMAAPREVLIGRPELGSKI